MSAEMQTLQALIEKRAALRLDLDMVDFCKAVRNSTVLQHRAEFPKLRYMKSEAKHKTVDNERIQTAPEKWEDVTLQQLFWFEKRVGYQDQFNGSEYLNHVRAALLPIYVQQETEQFLKQFEEMKEKVASMEESVEDLQNRTTD